MKYFDRNSNASRIPDDIRPLIRGFLSNTQIFDADQDNPPYITDGVKYTQRPQDRRATSKYTGDDQFVADIIELFDFKPLDFQVESWQLIRDLDADRRSSNNSRGAIFSAPTGFGKTEAFLGPLYQLLAEDQQDLAIVVYPSRALLQDQLGRILEHLYNLRTEHDTSLSVGVWTSNTPYTSSEVERKDAFFANQHGTRRFKLADCWCGDDETHSFTYQGGSSTYRLVCENNDAHSFSDREILLNRTDIKNQPGPDILLTTLESLELFSLKPNYNIIDRADTIVFDEVHLYTGLRGAHTANIAQNIEAITDHSLLWLGSSATVDDPQRFATDLFPVPSGRVESVAPPASDFRTDHEDKEHYYFLKTSEEGPGVSSMAIQQLMLLGHSLLNSETGERGKILSFIDSISQVNQKRAQLEDADRANELWQYHRTGSDYSNWDRVAEEMDCDFIESSLRFESVYSDAGFDAAATAESDLLLSTSFLEVGIDVGEITIVTQYRTPWDLSSFIQRAGRAARKEDTDSHIVVFLSDLTQDANMFYRADRFLGSEIRTPLKTDNHVIAWIHDQFEKFYETSTAVSKEWFSGSIDRKEEFLERFLCSELGYKQYYEFITEPAAVLRREFGIDVSESQLPALHGEEPVETVDQLLSELREDVTQPEISDLIEDQVGQAMQREDLARSLVSEIRTDFLEFCSQRQALIDEIKDSDATTEGKVKSQLDALESTLEELRTSVTDLAETSPTEQIEALDDLIPDLYGITGDVERLRRVVDREHESVTLPELPTSVDQVVDRVDTASRAIKNEELDQTTTKRKQIYYLRQMLTQLDEYNSIEQNDKSLYFVKHLLRGAYYYDRFLKVDDRSLEGTVWYVPPNYFQDAGKYFTVFYGEDDESGDEQSIDKLVQTYAPYRSEYQQEAGHLQAYLPETITDDDEVRFSFEDVPGDRRDGMITPDSITLDDVEDLSGGRALNIVRYCPECFQILKEDRCLRHNDRAFGKIHSNPEVETRLEGRQEEATRGRATLADITGKVTLTGVSLEITPARPVGDENEFIFTGEDRISQEITTGNQPLGFSLDTRGLIFDLSDYASDIDEETKKRVRRYESLNELSLNEVARHTAAHCFTQLVADIGGVNPSMLFYGIDHEADEVYVFERSQGGQGIVDLVYEDLQTDPGTALNALTHICYNPQVINERLWASEDFVERIPEDPDEHTVREVVRDMDETPIFPDIVDLIVDEVLSSIDRARQLSSEEGISTETAYRIKQTVSKEQVAGNNEFPADAVRKMPHDIGDLDRVKSLFFSPDIDGCVENLHLAECISAHDQSESLSYVLLERLREKLIERVPSEDATSQLIDREMLPGGEIDGTSVFFTL